MKKIGFLIYAIVSICLAILTLNNKALFYHNTSLYTDSTFCISLLDSYKFIPKLFTKEISLYTHGEYRPLGFLFVAFCKYFLGSDTKSFHIILLVIHLSNTFLFFLIIREFVSDVPSMLIGFIFLLHPIFAVLFNDPNQVFICLGLFFSLISLYSYVCYLRKRAFVWLICSILAFIFGIFTSKLSIFVPVFAVLFHHIGSRYKKLALGISFYLAFLLFFLRLYDVNLILTVAGAFLFVFIFILNTLQHPKELFSAFFHLLPFLVIILIWYGLSLYIGIKPVFQYPISQMDSANVLEPFQFLYIWRTIFRNDFLYILLILPFFIIPFLLNGENWQNIILSGFIIFFATFSFKLCNVYKNDVVYWENMSTDIDNPVTMLNLAQAYINANRLEEAKIILYGLQYERRRLPALVEDTINVALGILYHKKRNEKISAFYFLQKPKGALPGASKIAKWRLIPIGDFFFDLGYLSYAENFYASALVLDPYDIKIFKKLGKILVYKNFLRASLRYFDKVLEIFPYDKDSLLFAAFASKIIGDKDRYSFYKKRWEKLNHKKISFDKIYAKFNTFDKNIRKKLSPDPVVLFYTGATDKRFVYKLGNKKYVFWEVPFEIGKYFYKRGKYDAAIAFLAYASDISGGVKEVREYLRMAQQRKVIPTQEEIFKAIKEQEMIEREMRKRGINPWDFLERK